MQSCFRFPGHIFFLWLSVSEAWVPPNCSRSRPCSSSVHGKTLSTALSSPEDDVGEQFIPSQRKSMLERSSGVLYRKSVFDRDELHTIRKEMQGNMNRLRAECSSSIAQKRLGTTLDPESAVVDVLKDGSLHRFVEKALGVPAELSTNIPVEIRAYAREGAGMAWHVDDVLYDPPQIEVIWTLSNDSDCKTMWKEGDGSSEVVHSVETEPNSAIILVAGGAPHCVTHLKYGSRVILKFAYVRKGSTFLAGHKNQFESSKKKKTRKKRKRR